MKEKFTRYFQYFTGMSPLKKTLTVFVTLLIFIIVVEQPGTESSKRIKNEKYFLPKLVTEEIQKIEIQKPGEEKPITLQKKNSKWMVTSGHDFPADRNKVNDFLKSLLALRLGDLVSKNESHLSAYSVDEKSGVHLQLWDNKNRGQGDFYAGRAILDGQYLRNSGSNEVYKTMPSLDPYIHQGADEWKDKTLLSVSQSEITSVSLSSKDVQTVLEKDEKGKWNEVKPEQNPANDLSTRTLFDQLKQLTANSFADTVDASQINFSKPDYTISVKKNDDSVEQVVFAGPDKDGKFYAKNPDSDFIYIVDKTLIDNIFGLKFQPEETNQSKLTDAPITQPQDPKDSGKK